MMLYNGFCKKEESPYYVLMVHHDIEINIKSSRHKVLIRINNKSQNQNSQSRDVRIIVKRI